MIDDSGIGLLVRVLKEGQRRSLIGNSTVAAQIAHSDGFLRALCLEAVDGPVVDLGSGGGIPGLVLAVRKSDIHVVMLDSSRRSTDFLNWAVTELELSSSVEVVTERAEIIGRDSRYRGVCAAVVARAFGRPALTAECAAPLLRIGGRLIVSEPPGDPVLDARTAVRGPVASQRWPVEGCAELGLAPELELRDSYGFAILRQVRACPDRYPRRTGIPAKRPLF